MVWLHGNGMQIKVETANMHSPFNPGGNEKHMPSVQDNREVRDRDSDAQIAIRSRG